MDAITISPAVMTDEQYGAVYGEYKPYTDIALNWLRHILYEPRDGSKTHSLEYCRRLAEEVVQKRVNIPVEITKSLDIAIRGREACAEHHRALKNSDEKHEHIIQVLKDIQTTFSRPTGRPRSNSDSYLTSSNWRRCASLPEAEAARGSNQPWRSITRSRSQDSRLGGQLTKPSWETSTNWRA
ncbi:uncharacterized protein AB675_10298 [Cyphellophora attinorum]|uniref:DUF6604 domain-containing protein n=1 Tax=Cyphellophora attinorum TaxID=1664694 RepID=A0A0N1H0S6_9EURO|nr:uncharacterized protein AB675_10298 [Phialophora attinorum]KPI37442.1 hypothetical protein AB675_10298 [Phialophora attinorum]